MQTDNSVGAEEDAALGSLRQRIRQLEREVEVLRSTERDRYGTQEARVQAAREIARLENKNFLTKAGHTKAGKKKASLDIDTLTKFDISKYYADFNPVVTAFIDELTATQVEAGRGSLGTNLAALSKSKQVYRTIAYETLVKARNHKAVCPLSFQIGLGIYTTSGSRTSVELCSHAIPCGGYDIQSQWRQNQMQPEQAVPEVGDLILCFDNEQAEHTTYINRVTKEYYEVLTSMAVFVLPCDGDELQKTDWPEPYHIPLEENRSGEDTARFAATAAALRSGPDPAPLEAFISAELTKTLAKVCQSLDQPFLDVKEEPTQSATQCQCGAVVHKKKVCEHCARELPKVTKASAAKADRASWSSRYSQVSFQSVLRNDAPSIQAKTTRTKPTSPVKHPPANRQLPAAKMCILDPIPLNPQSAAAIKTILDIAKVKLNVGSKPGQRRWVWVCVDGIPFQRISSIIQDPAYGWVRPIYGPLHEELNMSRAWVDIAYSVSYEAFGQTQGFKSLAAKQALKDAKDLHKARDLQLTYLEGVLFAMAKSFLSCQGDQNSKTAESFKAWLEQDHGDAAMRLLWEQTRLLLVVFAYHDSIRTCDYDLRRAARSAFMPVWFARNHPQMARILLEDERTRLSCPAAMAQQLKEHMAARRHNIYQGHDAILEEVNKALKTWVGRVPDFKRWIWIARTLIPLQCLRYKIEELLGILRSDIGAPRTRPEYDEDLSLWTKFLLNSGFCILQPGRKATSVSGELLSTEAAALLHEGQKRHKIAIERMIAGKIANNKGAPLPVPITVEEQLKQKSDQNKTAATLLVEIENINELLSSKLDQSQQQSLKKMRRAELLKTLLMLRNQLAQEEEGRVQHASAIQLLAEVGVEPESQIVEEFENTGTSGVNTMVYSIDDL